jgi:hemolysin III
MPQHERRLQSSAEELANSVSHGVGLLAALVAGPCYVAATVQRGDVLNIVGAVVFAAALALMFLASTLFHALPAGKAKRTFRALDYGAIFILIAGSYTPFALGVLRGAVGWSVLAVVWCVAITGAILKVMGRMRHPIVSASLYLAMGWLVFFAAIRPLWLHMPLPGILWVLAGGIAYTGGVPFFAAPRLHYAHLIWHLLVLTGTACHFVAIIKYAA